MARDEERFGERHGKADAEDVIKLLEAALRIVNLNARLDLLEVKLETFATAIGARLDRMEAKIDQLVSVTARTDMTAAQEEKVQVELTDLDKIANQAPKQT